MRLLHADAKKSTLFVFFCLLAHGVKVQVVQLLFVGHAGFLFLYIVAAADSIFVSTVCASIYIKPSRGGLSSKQQLVLQSLSPQMIEIVSDVPCDVLYMHFMMVL